MNKERKLQKERKMNNKKTTKETNKEKTFKVEK